MEAKRTELVNKNRIRSLAVVAIGLLVITACLAVATPTAANIPATPTVLAKEVTFMTDINGGIFEKITVVEGTEPVLGLAGQMVDEQGNDICVFGGTKWWGSNDGKRVFVAEIILDLCNLNRHVG